MGGIRGIDRIAVNGGAIKRLAEGNVTWPSWSRDGKWVYYGRDGQLWKVPQDGGSPVQITKKGGLGRAAETKDGSLYYVRLSRIWKVPLSGGEETLVLNRPISETNFALTEDGFYFTAASDTGPVRKLNFFDFAAKRQTELIPIQNCGRGLAVSPDGRTLLFCKAYEDRGSLKVVENFH
jgi:Tol biopolymer transport system component